MRASFSRLFLNISLSVFFVLMVCCLGQAQSGRRAPKPLSPPTITPPPKESVPPPSPKPTPKQQTVIAGMETSMDFPPYMSEAVLDGFIARFNKASAVIVISGDKNMSRKEARDRAKKATESPVVLLNLSTQGVGGSIGQVDFDDLVVNFTIFSPGTGKVSEHGRVHIRTNRNILGQRLPTGRYGESLMKEAGRETADRVLSLLHVGENKISTHQPDRE